MTRIEIYDTTLRDGAQQEGMNLSVSDKFAIAKLLDQLGMHIVEGGWPGAIPRDTEFFERVKSNRPFQRAAFAAFGSTRKAGAAVEQDAQVRALLDSGAEIITLVAKSDIRHVERALRTDGEENLAMVRDTVEFLRSEGREVILDAEHFFDGYRFNPVYTRSVIQAAADAGARTLVLCDTNGGMLPHWVGDIVSDFTDMGVMLGIHAHNDTGCAVANSIAAVEAGARHVQGTINGYGERTGNADLLTCVANLQLKLGYDCLGEDLLQSFSIAHQISEVTNISPYGRQPYVGASAFAHKAGLHASAIRIDPDLYQHIEPKAVGNDMRMLVSDMAGRASIELKAREFGIDISARPEVVGAVTKRVKDAEAAGYTYDAADASVELIIREELDGQRTRFFEVESWRAQVEERESGSEHGYAEATVKVRTRDGRIVRTGEGNGPVNALDKALREALAPTFPQIEHFELIDFKVRILDSEQGTDATIRVLIETTDGIRSWSTVGVGSDVIAASWEALVESITWGLLHSGDDEPTYTA
ncbi:2-isopropylmalate synthase [Ruaniaceae bacterium KH17]|nr:2-isopropylmalate synthase [Ruaniaceae bacterium KH17]